MRISIFGLGYVGSVVAACLADQSHHVICHDIDLAKLDLINTGHSPILENGLDHLIEQNVKSGNLKTEFLAETAVLETDLSFIAVGTPAKEDGSIDLSQILMACAQIGKALSQKISYHTIVIRSTILPGTSEKYLIPCLEQHSGKICGKDFGFLVNPEFLREGSAIEDYYKPPKIVIGRYDGCETSGLESLYTPYDCPKIVTSLKNAEAIKYVDNSWHALKVSFANEIGNILKHQGIDSHEVMDIFALDTKLNISRAYLNPGFSFGGSCLPKDVQALSSHARQTGLKTPVLSSLLQANEDQIARAIDIIDSRGQKNILLLGLAFKAGTDDLRSSPLLKLSTRLIEKNYNLEIFDPALMQKSFSLNDHMTDNIEDALQKSDIVIIGNSHEEYAQIAERIPARCFILDLARIKNPTIRKQDNYAGICW